MGDLTWGPLELLYYAPFAEAVVYTATVLGDFDGDGDADLDLLVLADRRHVTRFFRNDEPPVKPSRTRMRADLRRRPLASSI